MPVDAHVERVAIGERLDPVPLPLPPLRRRVPSGPELVPLDLGPPFQGAEAHGLLLARRGAHSERRRISRVADPGRREDGGDREPGRGRQTQAGRRVVRAPWSDGGDRLVDLRSAHAHHFPPEQATPGRRGRDDVETLAQEAEPHGQDTEARYAGRGLRVVGVTEAQPELLRIDGQGQPGVPVADRGEQTRHAEHDRHVVRPVDRSLDRCDLRVEVRPGQCVERLAVLLRDVRHQGSEVLPPSRSVQTVGRCPGVDSGRREREHDGEDRLHRRAPGSWKNGFDRPYERRRAYVAPALVRRRR
ncbi:MAG: hypothetical protein R2991_01895 [Thermoanaerobaculia bacterium]